MAERKGEAFCGRRSKPLSCSVGRRGGKERKKEKKGVVIDGFRLPIGWERSVGRKGKREREEKERDARLHGTLALAQGREKKRPARLSWAS